MEEKRNNVLSHYKDLNIKRYEQLWKLIEALDYGTDVCIGGDEYCQTRSIDDKIKYYHLLETAYEEIKDYEQVIIEDYNKFNKYWHGFMQVNELGRILESMFFICKYYHEEVEFIKNEIKNKQSITVRPELHIVNTKKKKGRPSKPFNDILVKDKEATKRKLHDLIDGKEDSKAVIYIKAAIQLGMMLKPTHTQFINEFGNIVSKQIFNKYLSANLYSDDEFAGAKQALINN